MGCQKLPYLNHFKVMFFKNKKITIQVHNEQMLLKVQVAGWSQTALEGPPSMGLGSCPSTTAQWLKRHMVYITFFFSDQRLHAYANI